MAEAATDGEAVDGTAAGGGSPRPEAVRSRAALAARGVSVADYLARLGLEASGPPSAEALAELQGRHLERVVFENLEIQRGRPTTVEDAESAERIGGNRACLALARKLLKRCYHTLRDLGEDALAPA